MTGNISGKDRIGTGWQLQSAGKGPQLSLYPPCLHWLLMTSQRPRVPDHPRLPKFIIRDHLASHPGMCERGFRKVVHCFCILVRQLSITYVNVICLFFVYKLESSWFLWVFKIFESVVYYSIRYENMCLTMIVKC